MIYHDKKNCSLKKCAGNKSVSLNLLTRNFSPIGIRRIQKISREQKKDFLCLIKAGGFYAEIYEPFGQNQNCFAVRRGLERNARRQSPEILYDV